jgi:hypothetical protein
MVERFFLDLTDKRLQRRVFRDAGTNGYNSAIRVRFYAQPGGK